MTHIPAFQIIVYGTDAPTVPESARFIAGLFVGVDAHARWTVSGPTAEAAGRKMHDFWERERKAYEPRQGPKKGQPSEGVDAAPEPVSAVAEDEDEIL